MLVRYFSASGKGAAIFHSSVASTVYRTQEAYHRDRSTGAFLANVKTISANASTVCAREAILAEKREVKAHRFHFNDPLIELLSENPDHEHADTLTTLAKSNNAARSLRGLLKDKL